MTIDRRHVLATGGALALVGGGAARATEQIFPPERYIYFDHASDVLSPEALQTIREMRPEFEHRADPSAPVARYALAGSIDGVETTAKLQSLAHRRIEVVRNAMIAAGIDPTRIIEAPGSGVFASFEKGKAEPLRRAVHIWLA